MRLGHISSCIQLRFESQPTKIVLFEFNVLLNCHCETIFTSIFHSVAHTFAGNILHIVLLDGCFRGLRACTSA